MRLGFVSARSAWVGPDGIWCDAGLGRLIDALSARADQLSVALSVVEARHPLYDHRLAIGAEDFVAFPALPSVTRSFHKAPACARVIREVEARSDTVVIQLPFAAPLALVTPEKPRVYHVCMDQRAYVRASANYHGAAKVAAVATADAIDLLHRSLIARSHTRVVTHGDELLDRYGRARGVSVVSSSVLESEIASIARSRPHDAPFRVLFVGYLREEKGFDVLATAFEGVASRVANAELCIVGAKETVDHGATSRIERQLNALSAKHRVLFLGHKPFGPELFQCYADADVLALPTRSEGTPRVLVEARAYGCPVVASRVGGVPSSVDDDRDGLLVPPGDARALEDALVRIATDPPLKARLIAGGLERAKRLTVERFAAAIVAEAETACQT